MRICAPFRSRKLNYFKGLWVVIYFLASVSRSRPFCGYIPSFMGYRPPKIVARFYFHCIRISYIVCFALQVKRCSRSRGNGVMTVRVKEVVYLFGPFAKACLKPRRNVLSRYFTVHCKPSTVFVLWSALPNLQDSGPSVSTFSALTPSRKVASDRLGKIAYRFDTEE